MKTSVFLLFVYAATYEYWLDVGIANMRTSSMIAVIYILSRLRETLDILKAEANVFIVYIYIILAIVINDLYIQADTTDILKSIFFHIISLINFIFFFSLFSKNDSNFPKFFLFLGFALIIYKSDEFFFTWSRILEESYFQARISQSIFYLVIAWSFFLMHKSRILLSHVVLISAFLLFLNTGTRSYAFILFMVIIMSYFTNYTKIKFTSLLAVILFFISFIIFGSLLFKPEIIKEIIIARLFTFSSLMHFFNTFPFGIGSGGVVNLYPYSLTLSNFFGFNLDFGIRALTRMNYTTAHSFVVGALFKHGLLTLLPILYFLINVFNLNIKMISNKEVSNEQRLISICIITYLGYAIFFSGYTIFLIEFPMYYALTRSMYKRIGAIKL